jgi:ATP-binding cassette subfamily B protein/subfamily B ATP-binding cassette protein MsbA
VLDLLQEPQEMPSSPGSLRIQPGNVAGAIEFADVTFNYPGSSAAALQDINLRIPAGSTVALVGPSGAGKTTLCNLVARFYDPTSGQILLDNRDIRDYDVESFRSLLGVVEQEFIDRLPSGMDTVIGERGVRLSGGQRQRLAIARAILANPRLLILDEATSNLDTESEQLIQQSLSVLMQGRTCFVIAHRLSTIAKANLIVVVEGGRILQTGTHAQLMQQGGRYRSMVEQQVQMTLGSMHQP